MDPEDVQRQHQAPLVVLSTEDLGPYSIDELKKRIATLEQEIERCRAAVVAKESVRGRADSFFKT